MRKFWETQSEEKLKYLSAYLTRFASNHMVAKKIIEQVADDSVELEKITRNYERLPEKLRKKFDASWRQKQFRLKPKVDPYQKGYIGQIFNIYMKENKKTEKNLEEMCHWVLGYIASLSEDIASLKEERQKLTKILESEKSLSLTSTRRGPSIAFLIYQLAMKSEKKDKTVLVEKFSYGFNFCKAKIRKTNGLMFLYNFDKSSIIFDENNNIVQVKEKCFTYSQLTDLN